MTEVEAIKDPEMIKRTEWLLERMEPKHTLYSDIFIFGLNVALRISDLLSVRFSMIDWESRELDLI